MAVVVEKSPPGAGQFLTNENQAHYHVVRSSRRSAPPQMRIKTLTRQKSKHICLYVYRAT